MIRTFAVTIDFKLNNDVPLNRLFDNDIKWFWVDFDNPTEEESAMLKSHFDFHPLAIEDCLHSLRRAET